MCNLQTARDPTRKGDRDTGARSGHRRNPGVPARVCDNCGEKYVEQTTTAELLKIAAAAAQTGVKVNVRDYVAP
jgi:hypothetical protein